MTPPQTKIYVEILRQIREIIDQDSLVSGDKIPSERELADRLNVGRSSVREALRALEFLGMIETKRGEGTYIKDFRENHLVELLGTFILQDPKAIADLFEMNSLLEKNALQLLLEKQIEEELKMLQSRMDTTTLSLNEFMEEIVRVTDNHLLYRIWMIINQYMSVVCKREHQEYHSQITYLSILQGLLEKDSESVFRLYQQIRLKKD
ncbi:FadR/GntR family transcriptional regulator [Metabacillus herbersteinensis]|uniref:FadR/GntR family transcriptional regulator n=1 Tax=Metabacillus herbersteinensis TaxID=283816 RepID=A0ABV6G9C5_9BACI